MGAKILFMDYGFHCIKIYTTKGYSCLCDFGDMKASVTDKQLAREPRKASFLGLLAASLKQYDLKNHC